MMFSETLDWNNDMLLITPNELNISGKKYTSDKLGVEGVIYDYLEIPHTKIGFHLFKHFLYEYFA